MAPNQQSTISFPCRKQSVRRKMDFEPKEECESSSAHSPAKSPRKDDYEEAPVECNVRRTRASARLLQASSPLKAVPSPRKPKENVENPRLAAVRSSPRKTPRKQKENAENVLSESTAAISLSPRKTPRKQTGDEENRPSETVAAAVRSSPRKLQLHSPNVSNFVKARQALHTSTPDTICCRDNELATIKDFLTKHVEGRKAGSMYISGRPGTGKTACVTHILNNGQLGGKFKSIFINCMLLQNPTSIYTQIAQQLDAKFSGGRDALSFLETKLTESGPMIILILDEIDQMTTRDQTVLYSLFELPALENSRLVLIGLANSLDLTDRALVRLQSRVHFKPVLLNFPPYSKQQIATILNQRLQGAVSQEAGSVVAPSALQYLGGKISASSGDMRKAIDVCRRAVELAETSAKKQMVLTDGNTTAAKCVSIPMLCSLINSVENNRFCSSESDQGDADETPLQQRVIIVSLLVLVKYGKSKQVTLGKLHATYSKVCSKFRVTAMDFDEMVHTCSLVESRGILTVKKKSNARLTPVALRLDEREVEATLKDKTLLSSILSQGSSFV